MTRSALFEDIRVGDVVEHEDGTRVHVHRVFPEGYLLWSHSGDAALAHPMESEQWNAWAARARIVEEEDDGE